MSAAGIEGPSRRCCQPVVFVFWQLEGTILHAPEAWPFMGVGGLLLGLTGTFAALSWPVQWWVPEEALERANPFTSSEFLGFVVGAPAHHARLQAAPAIWIPLGHAFVVVTMTPRGACSAGGGGGART